MSSDLLADAERALVGLRDFQRQTVDHVHSRLFAPDASRRFLVADEVGLGKTLIARGVVAKSIQSLHDKVDRIDVVYICSNADIARQNIDRIRIGEHEAALDTRLTLLPKHVSQLKHSKARLNFVAFTPSTSFDLKNGLGHVEERALIYLMLRELWSLGSKAAPLNVLRGQASIETFKSNVGQGALEDIDPSLDSTRMFGESIAAHDVREAAEGRPTLRAQFDSLCAALPQYNSRLDDDTSRARTRFVGDLRAILAASCLRQLEPDLVILDEFQRFTHLLDPTNGESQLANQMFSFNDVRVLLLSATPYRMYTPAGDSSGEDHYADFVRTVEFLERSDAAVSGVKDLLQEYRLAMLDVGGLSRDTGRLKRATRELEDRLRRVMVRTERLGATEDRNGMLQEVVEAPLPMTTEDTLGYVAMSRIARTVEHHNPVEYWKSAPFLLSFMESDYSLTKGLESARSDATQRNEIARALSMPGNQLLDMKKVAARSPIDLGNGRLRRLVDLTIGKGAHRLLWLSPSLPYYQLEGPYAEPELQRFTKHLVFSSWRFVPRAVASLVSYEAERRMSDGGNRDAKLLRFSKDDGRLTGMPVLATMYPSLFLAKACDPLTISRELLEQTKTSPTLAQVAEVARERIEVSLRRLDHLQAKEGPVDQRWYWAAPIMLDEALDRDATAEWLKGKDLAAKWSGQTTDDAEGAWGEHVSAAAQMLQSQINMLPVLGRQPEDLLEVLVELGLGGPGPCLLRSMLRVMGLKVDGLKGDLGQRVRTSAAAAAWAFRSFFNQHEVSSQIQREVPHAEMLPFWRVILQYGMKGCLQAVLDEYAHVLRDHLGLHGENRSDKLDKIAEQMRDALSLRASTVLARELKPSDGGRTIEEGEGLRLRTHFAVRFGDQESESGLGEPTRADLVRRAFNSPFWPFVLTTTSVGQEGLDFHPYCHSVIHWNLPTNPVDLEQREGRVHRYKGHAVRRNVATANASAVLAGESIDPWEELFERAQANKPAGSSDIIPFWVHTGAAKIERRVLALPSSREHEQAQRLLRSLTLYRMVFGQPRQEDLLRFLMENVPAKELDDILAATRISLAP